MTALRFTRECLDADAPSLEERLAAAEAVAEGHDEVVRLDDAMSRKDLRRSCAEAADLRAQMTTARERRDNALTAYRAIRALPL